MAVTHEPANYARVDWISRAGGISWKEQREGSQGVNMHPEKRWTHGATRLMRQMPKSPKSEIGRWDSWGLGARSFQNDAPHEKCELYTLFNLVHLQSEFKWYEGGPALKPIPPAMLDVDRPVHYLGPEASLAKYAGQGY